MRNRTFVLAALALAAVLVGGGLLASNMGFKLAYELSSTDSDTGANTLGLPFNQQTNLSDAEDLIGDINTSAGSVVVVSVSNYVKSDDAFSPYTGFSGINFPLVAGEGYLVKVSQDGTYIIVGSHNPSLAIQFSSTDSDTGANFYSFPYHGTPIDADELLTDIGSGVVSVSNYVKSDDAFSPYTGFSGTNFPLAPGEAYLVKVSVDVSYTPSHY